MLVLIKEYPWWTTGISWLIVGLLVALVAPPYSVHHGIIARFRNGIETLFGGWKFDWTEPAAIVVATLTGPFAWRTRDLVEKRLNELSILRR
jgi:hypothetical protein